MAVSSIVGLGRKTITGILCAGSQQFEDWSAAYRLFEKERVDRQALFAPARNAILERLGHDKPLTVLMDDTLIRKRGRKIYGTAWKRDPLGPQFCTNFVWGQRYLQMSAALPDHISPGQARGIPIDFIHAPSPVKPGKRASAEQWKEYRDQQNQTRVGAVAAKKLAELRRQVENRQIVCAVDGGFTNRTMFREIPENTVLIGRIRKDAKLFAPPQDDAKPRRGRRSWYGQILPTPESIRQEQSIAWKTIEAYASGVCHSFEIKHLSAVRWQGTGDRTVQVVVIRPLAYRPRKGAHLLYRKPVYLICSDPDFPLDQLIQTYVWRWEIEVNFRDEKTVMGVGEAQVRKSSSVESAPAFIVAAYALLLLAGTCAGSKSVLPRPKWQQEAEAKRASTQQILNYFRAQLWNLSINENLTLFESKSRATQSPFYSTSSLSEAVCYAFK